MSISALLMTVAVPFGISFAGFVFLMLIRRLWAFPLVLAMAYVVGDSSISSFPSFPAATADEWLVFAMIAGCGLATLQGRMAESWRYLWQGIWGLFLGVVFWLEAGAGLGVVGVGLLAMAVVITFHLPHMVIERNSAREKAGAAQIFWIFAICAMATAVILALGASLKLALLAAISGAMALAPALVMTALSIVRPGIGSEKTGSNRRVCAHPFIAIYSMLLTGLFISGVLYANAPLVAALGVGLGAAVSLAIHQRRAALAMVAALIIATSSAGYTYYDIKLVEEPVVEDEYDPYSW